MQVDVMRGRRMAVRPQGDRLARSEPFEVFTRPQRSLPARLLGIALRLRAEITVATVALVAWAWLAGRAPGVVVAVVFGLVLLVIGLIGRVRRYCVRRALAVLTRHRLRAVFVERRVMNYTGNLPVLLWSRPTPVGERVLLLLRAGIDLRDVEANLSYIATGCFAAEARASAHRSVTALVVLDVIRRDPLSSPTVVPSSFAGGRALRLVPSAPKGA